MIFEFAGRFYPDLFRGFRLRDRRWFAFAADLQETGPDDRRQYPDNEHDRNAVQGKCGSVNSFTKFFAD